MIKKQKDKINYYQILDLHPEASLKEIGKYNFDTFLKIMFETSYVKTSNIKQIRGYNPTNLGHSFEFNTGKFATVILQSTPRKISSLLRFLRIHHGYSLSELSKITGFSHTSISHRESYNCKTYPNVNTVCIYLKVFGLTFLHFFILLELYVLFEDGAGTNALL